MENKITVNYVLDKYTAIFKDMPKHEIKQLLLDIYTLAELIFQANERDYYGKNALESDKKRIAQQIVLQNTKKGVLYE